MSQEQSAVFTDIQDTQKANNRLCEQGLLAASTVQSVFVGHQQNRITETMRTHIKLSKTFIVCKINGLCFTLVLTLFSNLLHVLLTYNPVSVLSNLQCSHQTAAALFLHNHH